MGREANWTNHTTKWRLLLCRSMDELKDVLQVFIFNPIIQFTNNFSQWEGYLFMVQWRFLQGSYQGYCSLKSFYRAPEGEVNTWAKHTAWRKENSSAVIVWEVVHLWEKSTKTRRCLQDWKMKSAWNCQKLWFLQGALEAGSKSKPGTKKVFESLPTS